MVKIKVVLDEGKYSNEDLLQIMRELRAPGGCPWDIEQTHKSIRKDLLEEAYEVADAIDKADDTALCEELGDLLLQVVFHSAIAEEEDSFDYSDVVDGICRKLILRHPHVFGEVKADNSSEVLELWESVKMKEKHQESFTETLKSVPEAFPALMRSAKVQKRAAKAVPGLREAVGAERITYLLGELYDAVDSEDKHKIKKSYGRLMFELAGMQQSLGVDAEEALNAVTDEFITEFEAAEKLANKKGVPMIEVFPRN